MKMGEYVTFWRSNKSCISSVLVYGLQMMFGSWLNVKMTIALSPPTTDDVP